MFGPVPILIATERVRAAIEEPAPQPRPARARVHAANLLRRVADRVEGRRHPRHAPASSVG